MGGGYSEKDLGDLIESRECWTILTCKPWHARPHSKLAAPLTKTTGPKQAPRSTGGRESTRLCRRIRKATSEKPAVHANAPQSKLAPRKSSPAELVQYPGWPSRTSPKFRSLWDESRGLLPSLWPKPRWHWKKNGLVVRARAPPPKHQRTEKRTRKPWAPCNSAVASVEARPTHPRIARTPTWRRNRPEHTHPRTQPTAKYSRLPCQSGYGQKLVRWVIPARSSGKVPGYCSRTLGRGKGPGLTARTVQNLGQQGVTPPLPQTSQKDSKDCMFGNSSEVFPTGQGLTTTTVQKAGSARGGCCKGEPWPVYMRSRFAHRPPPTRQHKRGTPKRCRAVDE